MSGIQHTDLVTIAEQALARCKELAPGVMSRAVAVRDICVAFLAEDQDALAAHFELEGVTREEAEVVAWKALVTLRIEIDLWAASIGKAFGPAAQATQAASQQRHIMFNQIMGSAQLAEQIMLSNAGTAASVGNVIAMLLLKQGVELDVPPEVAAQAKPAVLGPDGQPVVSD